MLTREDQTQSGILMNDYCKNSRNKVVKLNRFPRAAEQPSILKIYWLKRSSKIQFSSSILKMLIVKWYFEYGKKVLLAKSIFLTY